MNLFTNSHESFRGRIRNSTFRNSNILHLNILSNLCEVDSNSNGYSVLMESITQDVNSFYSTSFDFKKRRDEFIAKKNTLLEIHEILTRIVSKLTKITICSNILKNSYFFNDLVEFFYNIAYNEFSGNKRVNNKVNTDFSKDSRTDFIQRIKENKKIFSKVEITRMVYCIIENTIMIFLNIVNSE